MRRTIFSCVVEANNDGKTEELREAYRIAKEMMGPNAANTSLTALDCTRPLQLLEILADFRQKIEEEFKRCS